MNGDNEYTDALWADMLGEPYAITDSSGEFTISGIPTGTYNLREESRPGWKQLLPGGDGEYEVVVEGIGTDGGNFVNGEGVTVTATKIICPTEADLPNWGDGSGPSTINQGVIDVFLLDHSNCTNKTKDRGFQWGSQNAGDPGDILVGATDMPGWSEPFVTNENGVATVFLTKDEVAGNSNLWVREVLQDGYLPFTHDQQDPIGNGNPASAEMYCGTDVLNYDNYDRVDGVTVGEGYDCVAFNVKLPETEFCPETDSNGWYARYYNYVETHPDMNLDQKFWPDVTHGDPMGTWTADWYDAKYFVPRADNVDEDLVSGEFGNDFFPLDDMPAPFDEDPSGSGHNYHFGAHWTAKVTAAAEGDYAWIATSDDDLWIYLDGVLADGSLAGIHEPQTANGTMHLTAGDHIVDIFFAERHTEESYMSFEFTGDLQPESITPWNEACVGKLTLEKTADVYDDEHGTIKYTLKWSAEDGNVYDAKLTDVLPAGTTYVSGSDNPVYDPITHTLTWDLGDLTVGDSDTITVEVLISAVEPWADNVESYAPGTKKNGQPLPDNRDDPENALGEAQDNDDFNFVSLGYGGTLILEFDNYIVDKSGADIKVVETTFGNETKESYPEKVELSVSQDNSAWVSLGEGTLDENFYFENGATVLSWAKYVKLTDKTDPNDFTDGNTDGYDVDGVKALHSAPGVCRVENTANISGYSLNDQSGDADILVGPVMAGTDFSDCFDPNQQNGNEGGSSGGSGGSSSRSGSRARVDGDKIEDKSGQVAGEQISDEMLPVTGGGQGVAMTALALLIALGCLTQFGRVARNAMGTKN